MAGWIRQVPGFRSGKLWKSALAIVGYLTIALFIVAGLNGSTASLVLGLEALAATFLATNALGLRSRVPLLNSSSKLVAGVGWVVVTILLVSILASAAPTTKERSEVGAQPSPVAVARLSTPEATAVLSPQIAPTQIPHTTPTRVTPASIVAAVPTSAVAVPAVSKAQAATTPTATSFLIPVIEVVDGDTLKAQVASRVESVRVIGIDTPEVVDPRKTVECFGREASAKAKELLGGQQVRLILDPTQGDRDRYGRLLSYVEIGDRTDFGLWMIQNGYAHEYTYNIPYQRQAAYKAAYAEARTKSVGLWASETCNGDTKQAAVPRSQTAGSPPVGLALQEAAAPTPTPKPVPTAVPSPTIPPSPTAVPTRAPTATSTTVTEGQLALDILSVTSPVRPGGQATLTARTEPGANASITVYYKSGPSTAQGLYPKTADSGGNVSWTWMVGTRTTSGTWRIVVTASKDSRKVTKETTFVVR